ncbi:MAG: tetratricopeptide repeat protein [Phycisphaerae bacterium]
MTRMTLMCLATTVVAGTFCASASAQDAATRFTALYGRDLMDARQSPTFTDDLRLAEAMLKTARVTRKDPDMVALLCENAYQLARKRPEGYDTAVDALDLLGASVPEKAETCQEKLVEIYQIRYRTARADARPKQGQRAIDALCELAEMRVQNADYRRATASLRNALVIARVIRSGSKDEIDARLDELSAAEKMTRQAEELKKRLAADRNDTFARERLIELYLVDLDDPEEAGKYLTPSSDQALRTYIPLAARDPYTVGKDLQPQLAQWYLSLAEKEKDQSRLLMLRRARTYYEAWLDKHRRKDAERTKVEFELKKISDAIARLDATDAKAWKDLLKTMDLQKNVVAGVWKKAIGGGLSTTGGKLSTVAVGVRPSGSYELTLKFTCPDGSPAVEVLFPMGARGARLSLGGKHGKTVALHFNRRSKAADRVKAPGVRSFSFLKKQVYTLLLTVALREDSTQITVAINGRQILYWRGAKNDLSANLRLRYPGWRTLAIGTSESALTFTEARIRAITGGMRFWTPETTMKEHFKFREPRRKPAHRAKRLEKRRARNKNRNNRD